MGNATALAMATDDSSLFFKTTLKPMRKVITTTIPTAHAMCIRCQNIKCFNKTSTFIVILSPYHIPLIFYQSNPYLNGRQKFIGEFANLKQFCTFIPFLQKILIYFFSAEINAISDMRNSIQQYKKILLFPFFFSPDSSEKAALLIYYDQHQALRASIKQTMGRGLVTYSW
jgi:hypothetical protein